MRFLDRIVHSAHERAALLDDSTLERGALSAPALVDFRGALLQPDIALIGEVKRATPLKGPLDPSLDAAAAAQAYAEGGAAAVSVLTETDHFGGSLADLAQARTAGLPVLRKDFIVDPRQVVEARAAGADAVLLIARIVGAGVGHLLNAARFWGMEALVEVYDEVDVEHALNAGASVVGINHRDLDSFEVDPERTAKLAPLLPANCVKVSLSGVSTRSEVVALADAGVDAVLVGEALVRAGDPAAKVRELLGR